MDRKNTGPASRYYHAIGRNEDYQNAGAYASNVFHRTALSYRRNQYVKSVQEIASSNIAAVYA